MGKAAALPFLLLMACLLAALYGAVHNQISYTVSPDYFHAFKFKQFGIPADLHNRQGAALVGALASWWMGLLIGIPVSIAGLWLKGTKAYVRHVLTAALLVTVSTLLVGLVSLALGSFVIDAALLERLSSRFGLGAREAMAFARAGTMHNASYLGGGIGLLIGWSYIVIATVSQRRRSRADA